MTWVQVPEQSNGDVWTVQLWRTIQADLNLGVMRPLADTTVGTGGVVSIDFQNIPGDYSTLVLVHLLKTENAAAVNSLFRFNNDSGSNYDYQRGYAANTTITNEENLAQTSILGIGIPGTSAPANTFAAGVLVVPAYASSTLRKACLISSQSKIANTSGNQFNGITGGYWRNTAAITRVTITPSAGDVAEFSRATLYGVA